MDGNPCSIGALSRVFESDRPTSEAAPHPILQVLNIKKLTSAGGPARFVFSISPHETFPNMLVGTASCFPTLSTSFNQCSLLVGFCTIRLDTPPIFTNVARSVEVNPLVESRDLAKGCFVRLEGYREFNIVNKRCAAKSLSWVQ